MAKKKIVKKTVPAKKKVVKPASAKVAKGSKPQIVTKQEASKKIVDLSGKMYDDIIKRRKKPSMKFPVRSLANVKYDLKRGHFEILGKMSERTLTYNTAKTFAQSLRLMATTKSDLLDKNDIAGKREVYYNSKLG